MYVYFRRKNIYENYINFFYLNDELVKYFMNYLNKLKVCIFVKRYINVCRFGENYICFFKL